MQTLEAGLKCLKTLFTGLILYISNCCTTMSDFRLQTGDDEERRGITKQHYPCPIGSHTNEEVKVEEISIGMFIQPQGSQSAYSPLNVPLRASQPRARAGYVAGSQCPQIVIQSRVLCEDRVEKSPKSTTGQAVKGRTGSSNETKNIAKNYGKAIIAFLQKNKRLFRAVCRATSTPYQRISEQLPQLKAALTTVMGFRQVWTTYKYAECMRMVSQVFLRKSALPYVFNSKVANVQTHLKYRARFLKALNNPQAFDHIKDY